MRSWWELGEYSGYRGTDLDVHNITCPFCMERGNFSTEFDVLKRKPNGTKALHFDTLKCGNCASYVMVLWSAGETSHLRPGGGLHGVKVLPWPLRVEKYPDHWPEAAGRFWLQAHRSYGEESWDAAAVMTRSALQAALRERGAKRGSLKAEIDDLADKGELPPHMKEWAHELRELGNESAHPDPTGQGSQKEDVADALQFLDFLLQYLYNLPHEIALYRERRALNA